MKHKLTFALLSGLLLSACAVFPSSAAAVDPQQISLINETCTRVMGLRQGETYFAACQDSLSQSLAGQRKAEAMAKSYQDCDHKGLADGTPAFAACVLDADSARAAEPQTAQPVALAYDSSNAENAKSYYNVTPEVHWRREQYSCAQLGLMPGSPAFGHCVASLDASLLNPLN